MVRFVYLSAECLFNKFYGIGSFCKHQYDPVIDWGWVIRPSMRFLDGLNNEKNCNRNHGSNRDIMRGRAKR